MLFANTMPRTHDAPLKQRERGLYRIGRNYKAMLVSDMLLRRMVHGFVFLFQFAESLRVGGQFVGHDDINIAADIFFDVLRESSALSVLSMKESEIAAPLANTNDDFFLVALTAPALPVTVLLSAYVGFVHLDRAIELSAVGLSRCHSSTNPMAEIPCRAIVDSQHPLHLVCRHSLARLANQERRKEPLNQRQMGVVKHCVSSHGELVAA